jgi:hypothetical protein
MTNPTQPITALFLSEIPFRIVETNTGNQVFSASVTQTASASAYTYPKALSIAVELATESSLKQGRKLISEYLANKYKSNKSNKVEQAKSTKTCTGYTYSNPYTVYYSSGVVDFYFDEWEYDYEDNGIPYGKSCVCCDANNSSSELTSCYNTLTTNLCVNQPCGCAPSCVC